jgi:hypothetical protein
MDLIEFRQMVRPIVLSNKNYSKVFGIGFNKTGSTSLETIFRLYGFDCPNQQEQEIRTVRQAYQGNYAPLQDFVSRYDAFQDQPFSQFDIFVAIDALFPNSKFILTERDPEAWFESTCRFHKNEFGIEGEMPKLTERDILEKFNYLYPGYDHFVASKHLTVVENGKIEIRWDLLYDKDFYIKTYLERNDRIKHYFDGRKDALFSVDFSKEPTTERICAFLNIPTRFAVMTPHLNIST